MQADPHEAVRLVRRLERQLERAARRRGACRPCRRRSRRSRGHLPPRVAGSAGMDPATHIAHLQADAARLLDAYREDPHAAVRHLPAVGPRRPPPPRGRRPLVAPGAGGARTERPGSLQAEPAGPRGRRPAGLVRGQRARAGRGAVDDGHRRHLAHLGRRPARDRSTRAAWPTRRPCTAGTPSAVTSTPTLAVDGIDEHLGLFAPLAPGDSLGAARHDPPPRHRHRGRVAGDAGPDRHLVRARPRQGRRRAPRHRQRPAPVGVEPGAGRRPLRGVRRRRPARRRGAPRVRI